MCLFFGRLLTYWAQTTTYLYWPVDYENTRARAPDDIKLTSRGEGRGEQSCPGSVRNSLA